MTKPHAATYQGAPCKRGHPGIRRVIGGDCVDCVKERAREKWAADPAFRERHLARRRAAYATDEGREYRRERNLFGHYGMIAADYRAMREAQDGRCKICERPDWEVGRLHVDHDHGTGDVRALLCAPCNRTLGQMEDDPVRLRAAADYLESFK